MGTARSLTCDNKLQDIIPRRARHLLFAIAFMFLWDRFYELAVELAAVSEDEVKELKCEVRVATGARPDDSRVTSYRVTRPSHDRHGFFRVNRAALLSPSSSNPFHTNQLFPR